MTNVKHRIGFRVKKWYNPSLGRSYLLLDEGYINDFVEKSLLQENGFKIIL